MNSSKTESRVFLDRVESETAILITEDNTEVLLPFSLLPVNSKEGDWLLLMLQLDEQESIARRKAIEDARQQLGSTDDGGDLDL